MAVQYVIMRAGVNHQIDYNLDNKIDAKDDVVVQYKGGKMVGWKLLNEPTKKRIAGIISKAPPAAAEEDTKRIVYARRPSAEAAPVVIKDATDLGQYVKAGAGMRVGQVAVDGVVGVLGSLFSGESEGGSGCGCSASASRAGGGRAKGRTVRQRV